MADSLLQLNGKLSLYKHWGKIHPRRSFYRRPTTAVIMSQQSRSSYWASINSDIEDHLQRAIPIRQPLSVFEPMNHLVFAAPKNTAPALCIAACELVGGQRDQAMAAASALRLVYAAAYTHEHLPLTDRQNGSALNHVYGPNIELLTGDGITPFGFELLARSDDPNQENSERILRVMVEIARAMGSQGWVEGQYRGLQIEYSGAGGEESLVSYVSEKKEGGLHACGAACGAILGGGSEEEIEKLRRYGLLVGMIKGLSTNLFGGKENEKKMRKKIEDMKNLALKELGSFKGGKDHEISSFLDIS